MSQVHVEAVSLEPMLSLLTPQRAARLRTSADHARTRLEGRTVWNLSSTAQGGGVAEMLRPLVAYSKGLGVDTRWLVLSGDPDFFAITKRVHNLLHDSDRDGVRLGAAERAHYESVTSANAASACEQVRPGDLVLAHDPQTAGMVAALQAHGAHVAWRCHIGSGEVTPVTELGWEFLRGYVEPAEAYVFSRAQYAPPWLGPEKVHIIAPSIDPFSAKNRDLPPADVAAALHRAGLVDLPDADGSTGPVRRHDGLVDGGRPIPGDARIVLQVSRWDRLKDMTGVMAGFATYLDTLPDDVHLVLVGPDVSGVSDDPEGAQELATCRDLWQHLLPRIRERIHLICLPMDDLDENAYLVNALQRYATVVVQKSLAEGFGLTVTEPMWKAKPVVAAAVGGIQDQIEDGVSGLLHDPRDLKAFVGAIQRVVTDPDLAASLGEASRERVREHFLGDRHLIQFVELFDRLLASEGAGRTGSPQR